MYLLPIFRSETTQSLTGATKNIQHKALCFPLFPKRNSNWTRRCAHAPPELISNGYQHVHLQIKHPPTERRRQSNNQTKPETTKAHTKTGKHNQSSCSGGLHWLERLPEAALRRRSSLSSRLSLYSARMCNETGHVRCLCIASDWSRSLLLSMLWALTMWHNCVYKKSYLLFSL